MKGRWIALGAALGVMLALTLGFAHARGPSMPGAGAGPMMDMGEMWAAGMETMHDSAQMLDMHDLMPAELRAQCEALHEQMRQMMGDDAGGGMSGGMSGAMGGMSGAGSHASHHPDTSGS